MSQDALAGCAAAAHALSFRRSRLAGRIPTRGDNDGLPKGKVVRSILAGAPKLKIHCSLGF